MGKAPESFDDALVPNRVLEAAVTTRLLGEGAEERHGKPLEKPVFTVLEGKVEEHSLSGWNFLVVAVFHRVYGGSHGAWVRGKGAGVVSEEISGELVQQQYQRETSAGVVFPLFQAASRSLFVIGEEAGTDFLIKFRGRSEPLWLILSEFRAVWRPEPE